LSKLSKNSKVCHHPSCARPDPPVTWHAHGLKPYDQRS